MKCRVIEGYNFCVALRLALSVKRALEAGTPLDAVAYELFLSMTGGAGWEEVAADLERMAQRYRELRYAATVLDPREYMLVKRALDAYYTHRVTGVCPVDPEEVTEFVEPLKRLGLQNLADALKWYKEFCKRG